MWRPSLPEHVTQERVSTEDPAFSDLILEAVCYHLCHVLLYTAWNDALKIHVYPEPQNVNLFRNWVFADVIS